MVAVTPALAPLILPAMSDSVSLAPTVMSTAVLPAAGVNVEASAHLPNSRRNVPCPTGNPLPKDWDVVVCALASP